MNGRSPVSLLAIPSHRVRGTGLASRLRAVQFVEAVLFVVKQVPGERWLVPVRRHC